MSTGTVAQRNEQGLAVLDKILSDPGAVTTVGGKVMDTYGALGCGVRLRLGGDLQGFAGQCGRWRAVEGYRLMLASSNGDREGMALELQTAQGEQVADVFESEDSGRRSVRFYTQLDVPIEVVQWLLGEAERRL